MNRKLGVIGSSGGAALASAVHCLEMAGHNQEWVILTDRNCGLLDWAVAKSQESKLIQYREINSFSKEALAYFVDNNVSDVLLFYTRIVGEPLISSIRVCNIHPSLLPEHKGLNSIKLSVESGSNVIGCTLHKVDETLDTGPIIYQTSLHVAAPFTLNKANKISFLQKVWLTLLWRQSSIDKSFINAECNLPIELSEAYELFIKSLDLDFKMNIFPK